MYRIKTYYDENTECPLEWPGDAYAVVSLDNRHFGRVNVEGTLAGDYRFSDVWEYAYNDDDFLEAVAKHFQRQGYQVITRDYHDMRDGGHKKYVLAIDVSDSEIGPGYMQGEAKMYESWLSGDVYGVELEKRCECCDSWTALESIWGNYLTDDYTALEVAREHFIPDLPDDTQVLEPWEV